MLHQNQRVVDNPIYLCDLGASLSAAEAPELQAILEEPDVIQLKKSQGAHNVTIAKIKLQFVVCCLNITVLSLIFFFRFQNV